MLKKGAMFGLDARITLVIIGLIGLVSSASMISALTKSNTTRYLQELNSIKTAYKAFKTDTRYNLTSYSNPYFYNISELLSLTIDSNKPYTKKYNGPYVNYKATGTTNLIKNPILNKDVAIVSRSFNSDWATATKTSKCSVSDCFKWAVMYDVGESVAKQVESADDGSNNTGQVRVDFVSSKYDLYMPIEKE